jgi:hypothetical protein
VIAHKEENKPQMNADGHRCEEIREYWALILGGSSINRHSSSMIRVNPRPSAVLFFFKTD